MHFRLLHAGFFSRGVHQMFEVRFSWSGHYFIIGRSPKIRGNFIKIFIKIIKENILRKFQKKQIFLGKFSVVARRAAKNNNYI